MIESISSILKSRLWWNWSFDPNKRSIQSKKMHFSFVFDSFPLFYAKRPNRSRRSLIFFKDQRYRFAPVGLWKMSIRSFSKSNRSQKTIDSIENPMIEFPTLPKPDLSWKTRFSGPDALLCYSQIVRLWLKNFPN